MRHFFILCLLASACGKKPSLILAAERKAQIGGEFIRLFDDGQAQYGFGVITEKLKAKGAYHIHQDTIWFDDPSFSPHFEGGYLPIAAEWLLMKSGFHFRIVENHFSSK